ncbi:MAG TPA: RNA polymerase sigma factor [Opitutaceae bacterium]
MSNRTASKSPPPQDLAQWFTAEVHPHQARLKSYLRGAFPSIRDVDDVVQESYMRVWKRQLLRPLACARSFLYTVARNLAIDTLRRESVSPVDKGSDVESLRVAATQASPDEAACTNEELNLLLEAIDSLPPRCGQVVILRKLYGLSPREIAEKLGISEGTVHIHGAKGVRRCEEFLRERGIG